MSEVIFSVQGMTCGSCSATITTTLNQVPGVSESTVSLLTEEAKVVYDSSITNVAALAATIEDCGFSATVASQNMALLHTTVAIQGMTCGSCSASITEALQALPGVESASISLVTETGLIKHSSQVSTDQIIEAVENCGFDITIESSKPAKSAADSSNSTNTTLSILGMTCGSCVGSITEALRNNPHITSVAVSLITEEGSVEHTNQITPEEIVEIIENCGFDATILKSVSEANVHQIEDDTTVLQIIGVTEETELSSLQYNIEAFLNSSPGITTFNIELHSEEHDEDDPVSEDASSGNQVSITFNSGQVGIRQLIDGLEAISPDIQFEIINTVDSLSSTQLKVLSRIKEIQYWKWNFFSAIGFGLPVVVMSHTQDIKFWQNLILFPGLYVVSLLQFIITVHIYFGLGKVFNKKFIKFIGNKGKNATMDVLVCISTSVSFIFSVLSIIFSVWSGQTERPPKLLFDTVTMLVLFISFGKWLENRAKGATSTALSQLLSLAPTSCTIINNTTDYEDFLRSQESEKGASAMIDLPTRDISIDLIQADDIAIVLPGGKVPADGFITFGETDIDESLITGESLPVFKKRGDEVIGGSINGPDLIHIKVVRSGKNSQLQQIINLVKESQINKAPSQGFADYIAARFVPAVIVLSTLTFVYWTVSCLLTHPDALPMIFKKDDNGKFFVCLKLAISVIVVACPCALGLAAPTAIMVGTGVGASHGVLIKGGDILEKASLINVILFDKTGTLTTGDMKLSQFKIVGKSSASHRDWWNLIGSVEASSEHPVGKAIVKTAREQLNLTFEEDTFGTKVSEFKALAGLGVKAVVQLEDGTTHSISVGNEKMINQLYSKLIDVSELDLRADSINTLAFVIIDEAFSGYIELEDEIKENARDVLDYIRYVEGYQIGMVTGDSHKAARKIGRELGIPESNIFSEVSPINKDKVVVDLKERLGGDKNVGIAFVGDGINDAPALVQADIGMAMSSGTDIAIDSADIVLMAASNGHADLAGVLNALKISNATFRRVKSNFIWAAIYNMIMLPFAMGCFVPFNLMLPPIFAGGAMALSSVSVVMNSLLLKRFKPPVIEKGIKRDYELEIGEFDKFSLKDGSLEEFNLIKRNRSTRYNIRSAFRKLFGSRQSRRSEAEYEMLPSA